MKRFLGLMTAAVLLAAPAGAQQPIDNDVSLTILSQQLSVGARGYPGSNAGSYRANFTVDFPSPTGVRTFNDYLIWCIDANRGATLNDPMNYQLWSLADFAASTNGSSRPYDPNITEMTRIASLVDEAQTVGSSLHTYADLTGSIWSLFDGFAKYGNVSNESLILPGNPNFDASQYYVLWNGSNQTFLTRIPEPSSALLMFAGVGMLLVIVARRRRLS